MNTYLTQGITTFATEIFNNLEKSGEPESIILMRKFKTFVKDQQQQLSDRFSPKEFMRNLCYEIISNENSTVNVIMLNALTELKIATEMQRADCLADMLRILETKLVNGDLFWVNFESLVMWTATHSVPHRAEPLVRPLREVVTVLSTRNDTEWVCIKLRMVTFLLREFPFIWTNYASRLRDLLIGQFLVEGSAELYKLGKQVLESMEKHGLLERVAVGICATLVPLLHQCVVVQPILTQPICEFLDLLIEIRPEICENTLLDNPPVDLLSNKEVANQAAVYIMLCFHFKHAPASMSEEKRLTILRNHQSLLRKKLPGRHELLLGLAQYAFTGSGRFRDAEQSELKKLLKICEELDGSPESVYCYIALATATNVSIREITAKIFSQPLSIYLAKGCKRMSDLNPEARKDVFNMVAQTCLNTLFTTAVQVPEVLVAFQCLEIIDLSPSLATDDLVLQLSLWMAHRNIQVRKAASKFVLRYQRLKPCLAVFRRILIVVSTEFNDDHRRYLLKTVNKVPLDFEIVDTVGKLIWDSCHDVKKEALILLCKFSQSPKIVPMIKPFFEETWNNMRLNVGDFEEDIEILLIAITAIIDCQGTTILPFWQWLRSFAQLLFELLTSLTDLSVNGIRLLNQTVFLLGREVELGRIVGFVDAKLSNHMSSATMEALLDLIETLLERAGLRQLIHSDYKFLLIKLFDSRYAYLEGNGRNKYLALLSTLGPADPELIRKPLVIGDREIDWKCANVYLSSFNPEVNYKKPGESSAPNRNFRLEAIFTACLGVGLFNLLDILSNDSLADLHEDAFGAVLKILRAHRRQLGPIMEQELVKRFGVMLKSTDPSTIAVLIKNMMVLISVLANEFAPLVPDVVELVCSNWEKFDRSILVHILNWLAVSCPDAFIPQVERISKLISSSFPHADISSLTSLLKEFAIGPCFPRIFRILIPNLFRVFVSNAKDNDIGGLLDVISSNFTTEDVKNYAPQIIRTLLIAATMNPDIKMQVCDVLTLVARYLGDELLLYLPEIRSILGKDELPQSFEDVVVNIRSMKPAAPEKNEVPKAYSKTVASNVLTGLIPWENNLEVELPDPQFDAERWQNWYYTFFNNIFKNARHCQAISACDILVARNDRLKRVLFPLAFLLFYYDRKTHDQMKSVLQIVLRSNRVPREVLIDFVSAAYTMELSKLIPEDNSSISHVLSPWLEEDILPLDLFAAKCEEAGLQAEAIRIREEVYSQQPSPDLVSSIVIGNNKLGFTLAAHGIIQTIDLNKEVRCACLAETLGMWDKALEVYESQSTRDAIEGHLRCLQALHLYDRLETAAIEHGNVLYEVAAYWGSGDYERFMATCPKIADNDSRLAIYYRALYNVMSYNYSEARRCANLLRLIQYHKILESSDQAYQCYFDEFAWSCYATEIEDAITFIEVKDQRAVPSSEIQEMVKSRTNEIQETWKGRLAILGRRPDIMYELLKIHAIAVGFRGEKSSWIRFLHMSIDDGHLVLAESAMKMLLDHLWDKYELQFCQTKLLWGQGKRSTAIKLLENMVSNDCEERSELQATLGRWLLDEKRLEEARYYLLKSLELNNRDYLTWQSLANMNIALYEQFHENDYLLDAVDALLNGAAASGENSLLFTLRIISVLFRRGNSAMYQKFREKFSSIPAAVWVPVLPQVVARAKSRDPELCHLVGELMYAVGVEHPHVVLYGLLPCFRGDIGTRQQVSWSVFSRLEKLYPTLAFETLTFCDELVRLAISWWEFCQMQIEKAFETYSNTRDVSGIIGFLRVLHDTIRQPPATVDETMFICEFGYQLSQAEKWLKAWYDTRDENCVYQALGHYLSVLQGIKPKIAACSTISLENSTSKLANMKDLQLIVPGTYKLGNLVHIQSISRTMAIIPSKQRPRKVEIRGSDGVTYGFLLKGRENAQLDARIMQFFSFVNRRLNHSDIPLREVMTITTYNVTPLTRTVGLIGWVPYCTPIHDLLRKFRKNNGVPLDLEWKLLLRNCRRFNDENTPFKEKLAAFESCMKATDGNDLKHILLLGSNDSSDWITRRIQYMASLAVTSIAGYIVGLGDRHLSNIMMKQQSAKLVHIDFGDCFEVNQHRRRHPEKVPFRLTRMLVNPMEVSKFQGTFRSCCENAMQLMKNSLDQIIGLMEVFVYDPLDPWISEGANNSLDRIKQKLKGADVHTNRFSSTSEQITQLISKATDPRNLCVMFPGWHPWW